MIIGRWNIKNLNDKEEELKSKFKKSKLKIILELIETKLKGKSSKIIHGHKS